MRKGRAMTATLSYSYHNDKKIDLTPAIHFPKGRAMTATLSYSYHNDKKIDLTLYVPPQFVFPFCIRGFRGGGAYPLSICLGEDEEIKGKLFNRS